MLFVTYALQLITLSSYCAHTHTHTHTHTRLSSHYTALQFTCFSKLIMTCQYIYNIWMLRQCGCDFHTNSLLPFTTGTKQQGRRVREGESEREKHVWKEFYYACTWSNCTCALATTSLLLLLIWWICTTHEDALHPQAGCIHSTIASEGMVNIFIFICQVSETQKSLVSYLEWPCYVSFEDREEYEDFFSCTHDQELPVLLVLS